MKNRPSPPWAFLERYDIYDEADPDKGIYLTRWRIVATPWFGVNLHHIRRPDSDRALHDHPYSFLSIILRGGYIEQYRSDSGIKTMFRRFGARFGNRRFNLKRADELHRIFYLFDKERGAWSLLFHGPRRRDWGFSPDPGIWVDHESYLRAKYQRPSTDRTTR